MAFIEFKDVCKTYQMGEVEIKALDNINFTIDQGEFVVILGASGAGKTTILNLLGGMDTLSSGTIEVDGRDISRSNDKELTDYRRHDMALFFSSITWFRTLQPWKMWNLPDRYARILWMAGKCWAL